MSKFTLEKEMYIDIQELYDVQLDRAKANTVIRYHAVIRLALCYERKMGYIKENSIEQFDKSEKTTLWEVFLHLKK